MFAMEPFARGLEATSILNMPQPRCAIIPNKKLVEVELELLKARDFLDRARIFVATHMALERNAVALSNTQKKSDEKKKRGRVANDDAKPARKRQRKAAAASAAAAAAPSTPQRIANDDAKPTRKRQRKAAAASAAAAAAPSTPQTSSLPQPPPLARDSAFKPDGSPNRPKYKGRTEIPLATAEDMRDTKRRRAASVHASLRMQELLTTTTTKAAVATDQGASAPNGNSASESLPGKRDCAPAPVAAAVTRPREAGKRVPILTSKAAEAERSRTERTQKRPSARSAAAAEAETSRKKSPAQAAEAAPERAPEPEPRQVRTQAEADNLVAEVKKVIRDFKKEVEEKAIREKKNPKRFSEFRGVEFLKSSGRYVTRVRMTPEKETTIGSKETALQAAFLREYYLLCRVSEEQQKIPENKSNFPKLWKRVGAWSKALLAWRESEEAKESFRMRPTNSPLKKGERKAPTSAFAPLPPVPPPSVAQAGGGEKATPTKTWGASRAREKGVRWANYNPKAVEAAEIAERFCAILVRAAKLNAARREKMRDDNMLELAGGNDAPSSPMPPSLPSPHEQLLKAFPLETATPPSQSLTPPTSTLVTSQSPAPELLLDAVGDIEKNALMKPPVSPRVTTVDADTEAANKIVDSVMQELLEELV
ncbi:hypothetical protein RI054_19g85310 [Pseudoscourfieldia marina]